MSPMHPNWHATDRSQAPQSATSQQTVAQKADQPTAPSTIPAGAATVSRRPAAVVGIALVVAMGVVFFQGVETLKGQLSDEPGGAIGPAIRITDTGATPSNLVVEHGQTITFTNEQDLPHILESDTLCADTGFCLHTKTLFTGDSDSFTITPDMPGGSYEYFSTTSSDVSGTISIGTTSIGENLHDFDSMAMQGISDGSPFAPPPVSSWPPPPPPSAFSDDTNPSDFFDPPASDFAPGESTLGAVIPQNPYTIDNDAAPLGGGEWTPENTPGTETFRGGHGPLTQPDTGAGIWISVLLSFVLLYLCTRHCFVRVQ